MSPADDAVDAIFAHHGVRGEWEQLPATGVANHIYATDDVVLRIATDHPDAVPDARTESLAAPVARAAGLPVPMLVAFDDSRSIVDRPYSLWERVHGETVGLFAPDPARIADLWRDVGWHLASLHSRVTECPDPNLWLDRPARVMDLRTHLEKAASDALISAGLAEELTGWVDELEPLVSRHEERFLHNDIHPMNLMCGRDGSLLAILDWGDSGWGDPVLELAQVPPAAIGYILDGYRSLAPELLGELPEARIAWDQISSALDDVEEGAPRDRLEVLGGVLERLSRSWRT